MRPSITLARKINDFSNYYSRWFNRFCLVPFMLLGAYSIILTFYSWTMLFPASCEGRITTHETKMDSEDNKQLYFLNFTFSRNGKPGHGFSCVSKEHYETIGDGSKVSVFYSTIFPDGGAELDLPERRTMGYIFAPFMTIWSLGWNSIIWAAFLTTFINPENKKQARLRCKLAS